MRGQGRQALLRLGEPTPPELLGHWEERENQASLLSLGVPIDSHQPNLG